MSKRHHLPCGCRPSTAKRKGHRPACELFDPPAYWGRLQKAAFRRKYQDPSSMDHARGVILGV